MRPSCCGEPRLNSSPAIAKISRCSRSTAASTSTAISRSAPWIERDAGALHRRQHRRERQLDVGVERELTAAFELLARRAREQPGGVGGGGGLVVGQQAVEELARRLRDVGERARRVEQVRARSSDRRRACARAGRARRSALFASYATSCGTRSHSRANASPTFAASSAERRNANAVPSRSIRRPHRRAARPRRARAPRRRRAAPRCARSRADRSTRRERVVRRRSSSSSSATGSGVCGRLEPREQRLELELAVERVQRVVRRLRVARALPVERRAAGRA